MTPKHRRYNKAYRSLLSLVLFMFVLVSCLGASNQERILGEWSCKNGNTTVNLEFFSDGVFLHDASLFPRGRYVWVTDNEIRFDEATLLGARSNTANVRFEGQDIMYLNSLRCAR